MTMVCYEIDEMGELIEIPSELIDLNSSSLYCFIDQDRKVIYFWKGKNASIRRKFTGVKVVTDLRTQWGSEYTVQPINEGAEPYEFKTLLR
ncbi:MAG: hypothetical protein ACFFED_00525 [Candidatus Thorarchaeota archaeon]